jgi:hypothetical protein
MEVASRFVVRKLSGWPNPNPSPCSLRTGDTNGLGVRQVQTDVFRAALGRLDVNALHVHIAICVGCARKSRNCRAGRRSTNVVNVHISYGDLGRML